MQEEEDTSEASVEDATEDAEEVIAFTPPKAPESALTPEAQAIAEAINGTWSNKEASKPDISRLPDAVSGGCLNVGVGDKIIIERRTSFLKGNPYLDTRTYTIKRIDEPKGILYLWDDEMQQWAMDNYRTGPKVGQIYKIALGRFPVSTSSRKRGRPRKIQVDPSPAQKEITDGAPAKRGRGRPKGSKNRSREAGGT